MCGEIHVQKISLKIQFLTLLIYIFLMTHIFICLLISSDSCDSQLQFDVSHVFIG